MGLDSPMTWLFNFLEMHSSPEPIQKPLPKGAGVWTDSSHGIDASLGARYWDCVPDMMDVKVYKVCTALWAQRQIGVQSNLAHVNPTLVARVWLRSLS